MKVVTPSLAKEKKASAAADDFVVGFEQDIGFMAGDSEEVGKATGAGGDKWKNKKFSPHDDKAVTVVLKRLSRLLVVDPQVPIHVRATGWNAQKLPWALLVIACEEYNAHTNTTRAGERIKLAPAWVAARNQLAGEGQKAGGISHTDRLDTATTQYVAVVASPANRNSDTLVRESSETYMKVVTGCTTLQAGKNAMARLHKGVATRGVESAFLDGSVIYLFGAIASHSHVHGDLGGFVNYTEMVGWRIPALDDLITEQKNFLIRENTYPQQLKIYTKREEFLDSSEELIEKQRDALQAANAKRDLSKTTASSSSSSAPMRAMTADDTDDDEILLNPVAYFYKGVLPMMSVELRDSKLRALLLQFLIRRGVLILNPDCSTSVSLHTPLAKKYVLNPVPVVGKVDRDLDEGFEDALEPAMSGGTLLDFQGFEDSDGGLGLGAPKLRLKLDPLSDPGLGDMLSEEKIAHLVGLEFTKPEVMGMLFELCHGKVPMSDLFYNEGKKNKGFWWFQHLQPLSYAEEFEAAYRSLRGTSPHGSELLPFAKLTAASWLANIFTSPTLAVAKKKERAHLYSLIRTGQERKALIDGKLPETDDPSLRCALKALVTFRDLSNYDIAKQKSGALITAADKVKESCTKELQMVVGDNLMFKLHNIHKEAGNYGKLKMMVDNGKVGKAAQLHEKLICVENSVCHVFVNRHWEGFAKTAAGTQITAWQEANRKNGGKHLENLSDSDDTPTSVGALRVHRPKLMSSSKSRDLGSLMAMQKSACAMDSSLFTPAASSLGTAGRAGGAGLGGKVPGSVLPNVRLQFSKGTKGQSNKGTPGSASSGGRNFVRKGGGKVSSGMKKMSFPTFLSGMKKMSSPTFLSGMKKMSSPKFASGMKKTSPGMKAAPSMKGVMKKKSSPGMKAAPSMKGVMKKKSSSGMKAAPSMKGVMKGAMKKKSSPGMKAAPSMKGVMKGAMKGKSGKKAA
eukprot:g4319.t1